MIDKITRCDKQHAKKGDEKNEENQSLIKCVTWICRWSDDSMIYWELLIFPRFMCDLHLTKSIVDATQLTTSIVKYWNEHILTLYKVHSVRAFASIQCIDYRSIIFNHKKVHLRRNVNRIDNNNNALHSQAVWEFLLRVITADKTDILSIFRS